jgi:hypothetical protein
MLRSGPTGLFPIEPRGLRPGHNSHQTTAVSPKEGIKPPGPYLPLEPHNHSHMVLPQNRHTPFGGTAAASAMR